MKPIEDQTLVERLRNRAAIRKNLRKGEPDRIADLLIEAADKIELLEFKIEGLYEDLAGEDL